MTRISLRTKRFVFTSLLTTTIATLAGTAFVIRSKPAVAGCYESYYPIYSGGCDSCGTSGAGSEDCDFGVSVNYGYCMARGAWCYSD